MSERFLLQSLMRLDKTIAICDSNAAFTVRYFLWGNRMNMLWRKLIALLRFGWPLAVEIVDHGLDGDGLTREEAKHIIDTIYDRREGRHVSV